ncbi:MAG: hypothetical protein KAS49_05330 [Candidatus Cloacimonetes bacterium]|nr:hypothetical protein [Candidatus Cloacimonadota bacterium]
MRKTNDLTFLFLAFLYLIPILFSDNAILSLSSLLLAIINISILRKINLKILILMIAFLLVPIVSVFITVLLYTKGANTTPVIASFCGLKIYQAAFDNAIFLAARAFSLSVVSFVFLLVIKSDALVFSLMQNLKLPVAIGYSLMATFNAFFYMRDEFIRIRIAYKMRFQKKIFPLKLLIPILVSASRYAHFAGLTLESKGLHKEKTYTEVHKWRYSDWLILLANLIQIIVLIILFGNKYSIGFTLG